MALILQVAIGLFVLGFLVLIHELGHFLVAKACGIRVISFSIGFGMPIFKKVWGETEYKISIIPFGGYVHMAGEHPEDEHEMKDDEFNSKPIWQRALVAIAGPGANFLLAFLTLWILFIHGIPEEVFDRPVIGAVIDESNAQNAGLQPLDSIISINGKVVTSWKEVEEEFATQGKIVNIIAKRNSDTVLASIDIPDTKGIAQSKATAAGIVSYYPAIVGRIYDGYPASKTNISVGDTILSVNNKTVHSWYEFSTFIKNYDSSASALQVTLGRKDSTLNVLITPKFSKKDNRYLVGIEAIKPPTKIVKYNPVVAVGHALKRTWEYTLKIFDVLSKLINKKVSPNQLAGPVGIVQMSGIAALGGFVSILNFMALIGINLAVINLFPLIITDGGLLMFLLIEAVRGKPLSLKTQELINNIAVFMFIALFLFVTFNDVRRFSELFSYFKR